MHISPHIETAAELRPYMDNPYLGAGLPGGESPTVSRIETRDDEGPDTLDETDPVPPGGFAEILAELLHKAGISEALNEADADAGTELESVAETAVATDVALTDETDTGAVDIPLAGVEGHPLIGILETVRLEPGPDEAAVTAVTADEGSHRPRNAELALTDEPLLAGQAGAEGAVEIETELSAIDFPAEEQEILLGAVTLTDTGAAETALARNAEAASRRVDSSAKTGEGAAAVAGAEQAAAGELPEPADRTGSETESPVHAEPVRENPGRLAEARSRRRDRVSLEVRDFRSANGQAAEGGTTGESRVSAGTPLSDTGPREITMELRLPSQGQNAHAAETAWEVKSGQAFEDLLARELHQNFNNDIVRHASMILRDEGAGTIRLALRPESLGNVKIRLEMAENNITGHIVVESEEALRAFEREIHSLEQAFKESGFQSANLEMSLAPDGGGADQNRHGADASPFLAGLSASQYDAALDLVEMPLQTLVDVYQRGAAAINMLA